MDDPLCYILNLILAKVAAIRLLSLRADVIVGMKSDLKVLDRLN